MQKKKSLIEWLGLLGVISLISYTAAVLFPPSPIRATIGRPRR